MYILIVISFFKIGYGQKRGLVVKDKTTEVKLEKSGKPKSIITYNQLILIRPEVKTWELKYGTYKNDSVGYNVGIFDKNKNGSFTDIDEDILFVGSKTDSLFEYTSDISSRATVLKNNNYLNYDDLYTYKISQEKENVLIIGKVNREDHPANLIYFDILPNENLKLLNENKIINLRSLVNGKPTKLIFWATYCIPCFKEMDMIKENKLYESYNIVSLSGDGDITEARAMIKERKYPWLFLQSNEKIKRIFSQNGFPYTVNFNKKGLMIK